MRVSHTVHHKDSHLSITLSGDIILYKTTCQGANDYNGEPLGRNFDFVSHACCLITLSFKDTEAMTMHSFLTSSVQLLLYFYAIQ